MLYRIFDTFIASELALPGLTDCTGEIPDWSITLPQDDLDEGGYEWFHAWKAPDGQELMSCARKGENYLLNLLGLAQFVILFDERRIEAWPQAACTETTLAHLLQDQVIPRVICHGGRMVMHASAVVLQDGRAVAFTGPSGRGKSTLAAALLFSPWSALNAQNYDNPGLGELPVVSHPQDFKPLGIRAGSFMLHPGVHLAAEFTDNVFYTDVNELDDTVWHIRPYITAQSTWSRHSLKQYDDPGLPDVSGWAGGMGLQWTPTKMTTLGASITISASLLTQYVQAHRNEGTNRASYGYACLNDRPNCIAS